MIGALLSLVVGALIGRSRVGLAVAILSPIAIWAWIWVDTGGELTGDGELGAGQWLLMMGLSVMMALVGISSRRTARVLRLWWQGQDM